MKAVKNSLKTLLVFAILIPFFSFTKSERPSDSIKIVKRDNVTYMYLAQNINFSLNKVTINENCKSQLHLVIHYLKKYPKLEIEIGVHNDLRTKEDLTQTRASVLKGFFENYGANSNNIKAVGYGNNDLLNDCRGKDNKCSEKEQQANRRVEIKIMNPDILEDYVVINNTVGAIVVENDDSKEEIVKEVVVEKQEETAIIKEDSKSEEKVVLKEEIVKEVMEKK